MNEQEILNTIDTLTNPNLRTSENINALECIEHALSIFASHSSETIREKLRQYVLMCFLYDSNALVRTYAWHLTTILNKTLACTDNKKNEGAEARNAFRKVIVHECCQWINDNVDNPEIINNQAGFLRLYILNGILLSATKEELTDLTNAILPLIFLTHLGKNKNAQLNDDVNYPYHMNLNLFPLYKSFIDITALAVTANPDAAKTIHQAIQSLPNYNNNDRSICSYIRRVIEEPNTKPVILVDKKITVKNEEIKEEKQAHNQSLSLFKVPHATISFEENKYLKIILEESKMTVRDKFTAASEYLSFATYMSVNGRHKDMRKIALMTDDKTGLKMLLLAKLADMNWQDLKKKNKFALEM